MGSSSVELSKKIAEDILLTHGAGLSGRAIGSLVIVIIFLVACVAAWKAWVHFGMIN